MSISNEGEGGILALMSLIRVERQGLPIIVAVGLFGAALIYGDGAITPAISVLSALEGLEIVARGLKTYVLPLAVVILAIQAGAHAVPDACVRVPGISKHALCSPQCPLHCMKSYIVAGNAARAAWVLSAAHSGLKLLWNSSGSNKLTDTTQHRARPSYTGSASQVDHLVLLRCED